MGFSALSLGVDLGRIDIVGGGGQELAHGLSTVVLSMSPGPGPAPTGSTLYRSTGPAAYGRLGGKKMVAPL